MIKLLHIKVVFGNDVYKWGADRSFTFDGPELRNEAHFALDKLLDQLEAHLIDKDTQ